MSNIFDMHDWVAYYPLMYAAHEIKDAVKTRRRDIGLSQCALAELSGLSRATVIQLEQGSLKDLSITRVAAVFEVLGLSLVVAPAHEWRGSVASTVSSPLEQAARMASVSYRGMFDPQVLRSALTSGVLPFDFTAHMAAFLDEVPVSLLSRVVEQLHRESGLSRQALWSSMRLMAHELKTTRRFWHAKS